MNTELNLSDLIANYELIEIINFNNNEFYLIEKDNEGNIQQIPINKQTYAMILANKDKYAIILHKFFEKIQ